MYRAFHTKSQPASRPAREAQNCGAVGTVLVQPCSESRVCLTFPNHRSARNPRNDGHALLFGPPPRSPCSQLASALVFLLGVFPWTETLFFFSFLFFSLLSCIIPFSPCALLHAADPEENRHYPGNRSVHGSRRQYEPGGHRMAARTDNYDTHSRWCSRPTRTWGAPDDGEKAAATRHRTQLRFSLLGDRPIRPSQTAVVSPVRTVLQPRSRYAIALVYSAAHRRPPTPHLHTTPAKVKQKKMMGSRRGTHTHTQLTPPPPGFPPIAGPSRYSACSLSQPQRSCLWRSVTYKDPRPSTLLRLPIPSTSTGYHHRRLASPRLQLLSCLCLPRRQAQSCLQSLPLRPAPPPTVETHITRVRSRNNRHLAPAAIQPYQTPLPPASPTPPSSLTGIRRLPCASTWHRSYKSPGYAYAPRAATLGPALLQPSGAPPPCLRRLDSEPRVPSEIHQARTERESQCDTLERIKRIVELPFTPSQLPGPCLSILPPRRRHQADAEEPSPPPPPERKKNQPANARGISLELPTEQETLTLSTELREGN